MNEISSKTANVAELPLKLNLQLFAEDIAPNLEDTPEFKEDAKEFAAMDAKMEKFTEERKSKETPVVEKTVENEPDKVIDKAVTPEVAAPDEKPKQDMETNKAFQEMRQKLEAAEKAKTENEAKAKKADDVIAKEYGKSHGIFTVEQYEQRLQQEKEVEDNERYQAAGLRPDEVEKIREFDRIKAEAETIKQATTQQAYLTQWDSLYKAYPDIVETSKLFSEGKDPEWYNDDMKAEIARGASPLAAYRNAHFETILANVTKGTKETAKQEALNQLNSKDHIKANSGTGSDVEHVEIDPEQMRMFRALNKGKSDAEIRTWYKKNK
jgi:desulfoferrodoxin (superoxide reductase-like protein)